MVPPLMQSADAAPKLAALYAPIRDEMAAVEETLRREMRSSFPGVDEIVRYGCLLGGKRFRPALLLLSAKALGNVRASHITLAAVVEMLHTASLVHDDVLDEAGTRRHLATVNARWGNKSSVLLGDFLFSHAFYLATLLENNSACQIIGRAASLVCEGEMRQIGTRGNFELSEEDYLEIIEAKTAELCACACRLGAQEAGAPRELVERLDRFGRDLGIAFQIADDLLDFCGEEIATGKSLGTDLEQQKPTLPVIRALQIAAPGERAAMLEMLNQHAQREAREDLCAWLQRLGALEYARNRARSFADRAQAALEPLPASPAKQVLMTMAEFVVRRDS